MKKTLAKEYVDALAKSFGVSFDDGYLCLTYFIAGVDRATILVHFGFEFFKALGNVPPKGDEFAKKMINDMVIGIARPGQTYVAIYFPNWQAP